MRLIDVIVFVSVFVLLRGIYRIWWVRVVTVGFALEKQDNESFIDFMLRWYGGVAWIIRKKCGLAWWYNSKAYCRIVRLFGVLQVLMSIAIVILLFIVNSSDWKDFLYAKF